VTNDSSIGTAILRQSLAGSLSLFICSLTLPLFHRPQYTSALYTPSSGTGIATVQRAQSKASTSFCTSTVAARAQRSPGARRTSTNSRLHLIHLSGWCAALASGERELLGEAQIRIGVGPAITTISAQVLPDGSFSVLLGTDWISQFNADIIHSESVLLVDSTHGNRVHVPLFYGPSRAPGSLHADRAPSLLESGPLSARMSAVLRHDVEILPHSVVDVSLVLPARHTGDFLLSDAASHPSITLRDSIITLPDSATCGDLFALSNSSDVPVTLLSTVV
jgi:hypothetical protein